MTTLALIERVFLGFLTTIGRLALFAGNAVRHCMTPPPYPRLPIFLGIGSTVRTTVVRRR